MERSAFEKWVFRLLLLTGSLAQASEAPSRALALYGGAGAGYGLVAGSDYSRAPDGAHAMLSALGALSSGRWELDGGLSWLYSSVSGRTASSLPVDVRTRAGTLDLGARYRLSERWAFGPELNLAFGTDTSFGPSVGSSSGAALAGVKALYELPRLPIPFRLWAQLSGEPVSGGSRLFVALAGVQVGIPLGFGGHGGGAGVEETQDTIRLSSAAPEHEVRLVLDTRRIFFGSMSDRLRPEVVGALKEVGHYLRDRPDAASRVVISGHADQRGRYDYNLRLSRRRAEAVRQALEKGGVEPEELQTQAFGYLKPLDRRNDPAGWARNRRVEIVFEDVSDETALLEKLKAFSK